MTENRNPHTGRTTEETDNRRSVPSRIDRLRKRAHNIPRNDTLRVILGILDLLEDEL